MEMVGIPGRRLIPVPMTRSDLSMRIFRIFIEKKAPFALEARTLFQDLKNQLEISNLTGLRILQRYDVSGIPLETFQRALPTIFSEPQVDQSLTELALHPVEDCVFGVEYLPGQFDQRADSAEQCLRLLDSQAHPRVAHARIIVLQGRNLSSVEIQRIKSYCINPVDSREADLKPKRSLDQAVRPVPAVSSIEGFQEWEEATLEDWRRRQGLAMSLEDLAYCQNYFREEEERDPTETEIKVLDTYWSDHCRHTSFHTRLEAIRWNDLDPQTHPLGRIYDRYLQIRQDVYGDRLEEKPVCLMDLATIGMKYLRRQGKLEDLEISEEVNAASIQVPVEMEDGSTEDWLLMFKNETHNHPTEIEPFGGAATCLGGAIRDPLSGRAYVYQAMRVTGAADPRLPFRETLPGKLPQRVITTQAAAGYSSYGNQIGIATGMVSEIYHPDYVAKRLEIGAVVAAAPRGNVIRGVPENGDIIVLIGGKTGRDGIGGATGSSKQHTDTALENTAEVQKGNPPIERALQRLFRRPEAARRIKRCNDFGAGGVSVAIGEIADSLEIDLDQVPLKYEGLNGTDLAISESQERMAVCLHSDEVEAFIALAEAENLLAVPVAKVTNSGRLVLRWRDQTVVDISRAFLDTHGVTQSASVAFSQSAFPETGVAPAELKNPEDPRSWISLLESLPNAGQQGLIEQFDSTIGSGSVLYPLGGKFQKTPTEAMAALIPDLEQETRTASLMSWGFDPERSLENPYRGAILAVVHSVARLVATGAEPGSIRLTFQEYFERLKEDPERWAKPCAALLGALEAQLELEAPAIGGKDSMSGSFNKLDVPPTLVSFSVATAPAQRVLSPEFKGAGHSVTWIRPRASTTGTPDWESLRQLLKTAARWITEEKILSAAAPGRGGAAAALAKMAFGNGLGLQLAQGLDRVDLFGDGYGSLIVESIEPLPDETGFETIVLGKTQEKPVFQLGAMTLELSKLQAAWEHPLESVFPTRTPGLEGPLEKFTWKGSTPHLRTRKETAKPRVLIPAFPGSNCEWDSARAFRKAGAVPEILILRNRTRKATEESISALVEALQKTQILMLPGGFSAGDEPEGSGKFIATIFRNPRVAEATSELLNRRDGLILGICNGFQALIKLGLLPFGEIRDMDSSCPTLTYNALNRHVSRYVHTRVCSTLSPWLMKTEVGDIHTLPVSHGEGKFSANPDLVKTLAEHGQVATQYVDFQGNLSLDTSINPNGSHFNIEGITSRDGRIFGKMGHSERCGPHLAKNIPGNKDQPLFEGGVAYFTG